MNPLNFYKHVPFLLRKKLRGKYIVIESDDWGMERAITQESLEWVKKKFDRDKFSRWTTDSLETKDDLAVLFDLIEKYKTKFESPPVVTANFITHNVDYSSGGEMKFIPISEGFNKGSEDVRELYKTGIRDNYIYPQLHGYSHFNLIKLKDYFFSEEGKEAFENKFLCARSTIRGNLSFLHGEFGKDNLEYAKLEKSITEFINTFGFISKSIIPPTFILDKEAIKLFRKNKLELIQSSNRLKTSSNTKHYFPYLQKRKGMYWSIRNARLDPHDSYGYYHEQCLKAIDTAFENKLPAVIDFHRVNFAGRFASQYRDRTIKELDLLFSGIQKNWPEAKFIHTEKLNEILWQQETR